MEETILGRSFLKKIGFDLHENLPRSYKHINGKFFDSINTRDIKMSAATYSGLPFNMTEDDPIEFGDAVSATIGDVSPREIDEAFQTMVSTAPSNGLSGQGYFELLDLLKEFRDIFRVILCADTLAKVVRLPIRLNVDAAPQRASQRRYATKQR